MTDVIVTTPKSEMMNAAKEAADCIANGGGYYFRRFGFTDQAGKLRGYPKNLWKGDRVWYTEDGYVRGYAVVDDVLLSASMRCDTTGREWPPGCYVMMRADSWTWVKPVKFKGFQGWRYHVQGISPQPVGGWLDPRPVPATV